MAEREIMTVKQVTAYLQVHQSTIYRLVKRREIPCFKVGSDWRFVRSEVEKWCAARTLGGRLDVDANPDQLVMGTIKRSVRG